MQRPSIGLGLMILKDRKILLGKRKGSHGSKTWSFPGGHLEKFESFEKCALRENEEETGLTIKLIDQYPCAITNDFFCSDNKHYVTLYLRAEYVEGNPEVKEPQKCEEWNWFAWSKLPSPLFLPVQNLIKQNYNPFE